MKIKSIKFLLNPKALKHQIDAFVNNTGLFFNGKKIKPINYQLIPRITYAVSKRDLLGAVNDNAKSIVEGLLKEKTAAVTSERHSKWQQALAKAQSQPND